jgi:hypothetical protein
MSKRSEHTFQFDSKVIAEAANAEAEYHEGRAEFWQGEQAKAAETVKQTASVELKEFDVTGGKRIDVGVNYGDMTAYRRLTEAYGKIQTHQQDAERYRSDAEVYGTQNGRVYELDTEDVHHFRLHGGPRED